MERFCQPRGRRVRRGVAVGLLCAAGALACAARPPEWSSASLARADVFERTLAETSAPEEGSLELQVQLAFGGTADLDLYVTDPLEETIYFARRETRSGGRLDRDLRCSDPSPRIERAVFPKALPGRYRVGVDYHSPCSSRGEREAFTVQVDYRGVREVRRQEIDPRHFEVVVWEFEIGPP